MAALGCRHRHPALVSAGVPEADRFQRVIELDPENVMVCFDETAWESWAFGGGRLSHA